MSMLAPADSVHYVLQAGAEGRSSTEERTRAFLHAALLGSAQEAAHMRKACSSHIKARRQALQEEEALASGGAQVRFMHTMPPAFGPGPVSLRWLACASGWAERVSVPPMVQLACICLLCMAGCPDRTPRQD